MQKHAEPTRGERIIQDVEHTLYTGLTRAHTFYKLCTKAHYPPPPEELTLKSGSLTMNLGKINHRNGDTLNHYTAWVTAHTLTDLYECFILFLTKVFNTLIHERIALRSASYDEFLTETQKFQKRDIHYKIKSLSDIGIAIEFKEHILSFNKLRNCNVHRFGHVSPKDCNTDSQLKITWLAQSLSRTDIDYNELPPLFHYNTITRSGGVSIPFFHTEKSFNLSSTTDLSSDEHAEIVYFFYHCGRDILHSLFERLHDNIANTPDHP